MGTVSRTRLVVAAMSFAFALKLVLAFSTYGTNDVLTWEGFAQKLQQSGVENLYRGGVTSDWQKHGKAYTVHQSFNHPPFMTHVLKIWSGLEAVTGIPLRTWLRISSSLADVAMLCLLLGILRAEKIPLHSSVLVAIALSPVAILVSGFHGNTDPIMIALVLLSVYLTATGHPAWTGGAALGLAMCVKVVPVIFLPAMLLYVGSTRRRLAFGTALAAVFALGSTPYLVQYPVLIAGNVFGYSPIAGFWGLAELALLVSEQALTAYLVVGKILSIGAVLFASLWMHFRTPGGPLLVRCSVVAFLFLFLAPGFGVQYLAWLIPWVAVLPWQKVCWHSAIVAADVIFYYGAYSRWRWYQVNTFTDAPPTLGLIGMMHMVCWISMGVVLVSLLRTAAGPPERPCVRVRAASAPAHSFSNS